jgi:hypothetical protein
MKLMTVLALAGGLVAAPIIAAGNASADPTDEADQAGPTQCDGAGCVPYVHHDAVAGAQCLGGTRWDFGLDASSKKTFVCAMTNQWVPTRPLIGVRAEGAPCAGETRAAQSGAAQSFDGLPLSCDGQGWRQDYTDIFYKKTS